MTALPTTLQAFFTDRLARQRQVSPNTLAAYRDTLRLLLVFAADKKGKEPSTLDIDDLDAPLIGAFLDDLEHQRKNTARTRNARLAAIRSLFRRPSPSRSCRPHRARSCHPSQAFRQKARDLPDRAGNQRAACRP